MKFIRLEGDEILGRIEEGLFLNSGKFHAIRIGKDNKAHVQKSIPTDQILIQEPDGWTSLTPMYFAESDGFRVEAGETSYGGYGFVLLKDKLERSIDWYIQYSHMFNNPVSIKIEEKTVKVLTDAYPKGVLWSIPIERPELLKIEVK